MSGPYAVNVVNGQTFLVSSGGHTTIRISSYLSFDAQRLANAINRNIVVSAAYSNALKVYAGEGAVLNYVRGSGAATLLPPRAFSH